MGEHKTSARCAEAGGNVERAKTLACRRSRPQLTSSALQQGGRHGCCSFPLAASFPPDLLAWLMVELELSSEKCN